ncbi:YaaA family protein [Aestuariimicrobium sp. T2.26MG-19.2B]|uniref:YaaA family protein n=1 Tax=Aestuariimicrobium sp. T2.26MG-19.2B TaxID=3040679 RepID=UPI0025415324|nr:peroxide stress protein YaaA [Aestuariimicrobium sp. T2.26MG-19.2B]
MLILLPPSEGKATRRRGAPMRLDRLGLAGLNPAREAAMAALAQASARPDALEVLGVGASLADEVRANTRLESAPALRASELYTGVLYEALALGQLDPASSRRAARQVRIFSALHGVLSLGDRLSPYRLSAGVTLPGLGNVTSHWRESLSLLDAEWADELLVDCRSGPYRSMWRPVDRSRWVTVDVPAASHFAKHTRGLVARALVQHGGRLSRPQQLLEALDGFSPSLSGSGAGGWQLTVVAPQ